MPRRSQRVRLVDTAATPPPQSFNALCEELVASKPEPPAPAPWLALQWRCPWLVPGCGSASAHADHPSASALLSDPRTDEFVISMIARAWEGDRETLELLVSSHSLSEWELRSLIPAMWSVGWGLDPRTRERRRDEYLQILLQLAHLSTESVRMLVQRPLTGEQTLAVMEHRSWNDLLEIELVLAASEGPEGAGRREALEAAGSLDGKIALALTRIRGEQFANARQLRKRARQLRALAPKRASASAYVQLVLGLANEWEGDAVSLAHTARGCLV